MLGSQYKKSSNKLLLFKERFLKDDYMLDRITVKSPAKKNGACKVGFKAYPSLFGTQSDLLDKNDSGTLTQNPCDPAEFAWKHRFDLPTAVLSPCPSYTGQDDPL